MLVQIKRLLVGLQIQLFSSFYLPLSRPSAVSALHTIKKKKKTNQTNRKWTQLNHVNELSEVFECAAPNQKRETWQIAGARSSSGKRKKVAWWTNKALQIFMCNRSGKAAGGRAGVRRVLKSTRYKSIK